MPIQNLDKIFHPVSIVVIGASPRSGTVGDTVLRNLIDEGFSGWIAAVNPKYQSIGETLCYPHVSDLPTVPDLAVICTPAAVVSEIVTQCGEAGIQGLVILSAGFREAGTRGIEREQEILRAAKKFPGLRILGPNCLGLMAPHASLNASFANASPLRGNLAFISQSGALCTSVLDWALHEKIGFSYFVSIGNMIDVSIADLIDYFAGDKWTDAIILYVESISEPRHFMSAARAFSKNKPIIACKSGRYTASAHAASSHTGALAGVDAVYDAAFARAGIVRVYELEDLFDCAEILSRPKRPQASRLAIVTNAGGPGVIATDSLLERQGTLAELTSESIEKLNHTLPENWSHNNPVDVLGDASPERIGLTLEIVLADKNVDGALVILTPQSMSDPTGAAESVIQVSHKSRKPVLAVWMGGGQVFEGIELLNRAGIPTYSVPEKAVRAFMYMVSYARNLQLLYETPREIPLEFPLDRSKLRAVFDTILSEGLDVLSESTSKALLEAYEIPVAKTFVARTAEDAVELARRVGFPVALKVISPQISHKTDAGGVELNLANETEVRAAFDQIRSRVHQWDPQAQITGVTVQRMESVPHGYELIAGAKRDPIFGSVLLIGAGGITAELYQDTALVLPPLNEHLARHALESLRSWPLLSGFRGRVAMNVDRLIEIFIRLSYLVADYPEIVELDINPLLISPDNVIALDARIVLDHDKVLHPVRPYSHLAIRPYPEEFLENITLKNGTRVLLRAIKPEDEPMWHELIASCSPESIRLRFRYMFKSSTHELATRFCFIDYDRELAIVAESEVKGHRKLLGVGRLIADADHTEAEYALLVGDPWHGLGLGSKLTDYCLEICRQWGVRHVYAETASNNVRMLAIFRHRNFTLTNPQDSDTVFGSKNL